MEASGQQTSGGPTKNVLSRLPVGDSLGQFLKRFYAQFCVDEMSQELLRERLAKHMIHSISALSKTPPEALISSGVPALFVDECARSGMFRSGEEEDDKSALASLTPQSIQTGSKLQISSKWNIFESVPYLHASHDTPYKREISNSKRAENWSVEEMMILLVAKKLEDEISVAMRLSKNSRTARETWQAISDRIIQKNVQKTSHQCWIKWVKLNKSFRKIYRYENNIPSSHESFWNLSTKARKEMSMPTSFNQDVYNTMVEKFGDGKEARRGGSLISSSIAAEKQINVSEALESATVVQDDVLSVSSQLFNFDLQQLKRQRTTHPMKGERIQNIKQLIMYYEDMEDQKLQIERQRIFSEEKRNMSLCNSISEIAAALRSIADKIHSKA